MPADIGFVMDGSDSIADNDWERQKNFVANLINNFDIGPATIHAGMLVYSMVVGDVVNFTPFKPKQLLMILARNLRQPKINTNTARGIQRMRSMLREQGRRNAPKVMIIVTDGKSSSPTQTINQARLAKEEGIIVVAVGVGTAIFRTELEQIATNKKKMFEVSDFKSLQQIVVTLRDLICQGMYTCTIH